MKVLVLSHLPLLADGVAGALQEQYGFQALPAYSPAEVEESLSMFSFDVAVVDWEETQQGSQEVASDETTDAVYLGMRIQHSQPRCKVLLYREQIPEELGNALTFLEYLKSEGSCFQWWSTADKFEILYDMLREIEIQLTH